MKYDDDENLESRILWLRSYGNNSSAWEEITSPEKGHIVEILGPSYVSKPCWKEVGEAAEFIDAITLDINKFSHKKYEEENVIVHQFFFSNIDTAKKMALRVQNSARNIRRDDIRRARLDEAGGFHNKEILEQLFEIQHGCCYYSGAPLIKKPKNYVVDHIQPICEGGSDWPKNLALSIKEINTWKGGHASIEDTLEWLAKQLGYSWFLKQKKFCKEVDKKREKLDFEFRQKYENT